MTVEKLIKLLSQYPKDARVERIDGEYNDSTSPVERITYYSQATFGQKPNTVVIS